MYRLKGERLKRGSKTDDCIQLSKSSYDVTNDIGLRAYFYLQFFDKGVNDVY